MTDPAEVLAGFRADLAARGMRPVSVDHYRRVVDLWLRHLKRAGVDWLEAGPDELRGFLDAKPADRNSAKRRRGPWLSDASRCQYDKAVRALYRWATDEGVIPSDPFRRSRSPSRPDPLPRALDLSDVARLLDHVAGDERLRVAVWLAYGLGLRRSEIALARVEDVRLSGRPAMLVHGKGGRDRLVPLPEPVRCVLAVYLAGRPRSGPLLESSRSPDGLKPQTVGQMISHAMRAAGIDETGHALRHTFATTLLAAAGGTNLRAVSRLLGHRSVTTTERVYTSSYDEDAWAAAKLLPDPRRHP